MMSHLDTRGQISRDLAIEPCRISLKLAGSFAMPVLSEVEGLRMKGALRQMSVKKLCQPMSL